MTQRGKMREIRFRLYSKHDKKMYIFDPRWGNFEQGGGWVGGVLETDYVKDGRRFAPSNQRQLEPESCEWLEFTGLFDKNGKEIYEGDLLRVVSSDGYLQVNPLTVEWDSIGWQPWLEGGRDRYYALSSVEVVGNIYDNSELLGEKEKV